MVADGDTVGGHWWLLWMRRATVRGEDHSAFATTSTQMQSSKRVAVNYVSNDVDVEWSSPLVITFLIYNNHPRLSAVSSSTITNWNI